MRVSSIALFVALALGVPRGEVLAAKDYPANYDIARAKLFKVGY